MAKGRRRRQVAWRSVGAVAHCWVVGKTTCVCNAFSLSDSGVFAGEERCRQCEIALEQLW